jgi:hypothetical protein
MIRCGEKHPLAKLTAEKVLEIRRRYAKGDITLYKLAGMYGIANQNVSKIVNHLTWKHVEDEFITVLPPSHSSYQSR